MCGPLRCTRQELCEYDICKPCTHFCNQGYSFSSLSRWFFCYLKKVNKINHTISFFSLCLLPLFVCKLLIQGPLVAILIGFNSFLYSYFVITNITAFENCKIVFFVSSRARMWKKAIRCSKDRSRKTITMFNVQCSNYLYFLYFSFSISIFIFIFTFPQHEFFRVHHLKTE